MKKVNEFKVQDLKFKVMATFNRFEDIFAWQKAKELTLSGFIKKL